MTQFDDIMEAARRAYAGGRPDEAIGLLGTALEQSTEIGQRRLIAGLHRRFGRLPLAAAALREVLALDPLAPDAWLHLALMSDDVPLLDGDIEALRAALDATSDENRVPLGFALGKVLADRGDIADAAGAYARANALRHASIAYSSAATAALFARTRDTFTPEFFARSAGSGDASASPIFIVGMPRSGSTLTEQILASHRDVLGGGEMNLMSRIDKTMLANTGAPHLAAALEGIGVGNLKPWTEAYLGPVRTALASASPRRSRITDKNLENFARIGLIKVLFPNARVVHCMRDSLDTCLSIWRRLFAADSVPYAYDQAELGTYFRLQVQLMEHWQAVLPGFVHPHSYEALVADPEPSIRALLSFCGLDWDDNCLSFHRTERGIATASAAQVRRPVHTDAVGAAGPWRPHLGALISTLESPLQIAGTERSYPP